MSTAIVITSGKGGTGKTSITGGVASCLAALGHRVLCIDMDIGLRNLDLTLGLSDRALMDFTDAHWSGPPSPTPSSKACSSSPPPSPCPKRRSARRP